MKSLKGTQTEKNILTAFAGESQARNRYTYFASAAKKEGYELIAAIFTETADQEKEHAKRLFKFLEGGELEISAAFPAGRIAAAAENLTESIAGEDHEWKEMYPSFAKVAKEEGFDEIADCMLSIAKAEKYHSERYAGLKKLIVDGKMFKDDTTVFWQCMNCGFVMDNDQAPEQCPACAHAQAYFRRGIKY